MPRRKLRLEANEQEAKALDEIKRIHDADGRILKPGEARKLLKRLRAEKRPGYKVRVRNGRPQYKSRGFGQWRECSPLEYENAKAERDYLVEVSKSDRDFAAAIKKAGVQGDGRRKRGDETRRRVLEAWNTSAQPEKHRVRIVAKQLGMSQRHVRRILRTE